MGALGWIAFGIVLLLAVGVGIPGVADGVMSGAQKVAQYPAIAQASADVQAWLGAVLSGAFALH